MKNLLRITLICALNLAVLPQAQAHTVLIGSNPNAGTTVAQLPESVTLYFANPLLTLGSKSVNQVQVTDPMGMVITSTNNVVKGSTLSNVLQPSMVMAGTYKVGFRVVAQDGHVITGSFNFTVGATNKSVAKIKVPKSGVTTFTAVATGQGVLDGVGSPTDKATGRFTVNFSTDTFCYLISANIKDVTAAHVHAASQKNLTISDEIFLPLDLASINAKQPVCQKEDGQTLATLVSNWRNYLFMLHTKRYPNGDVAGGLRKVAG